jgi:uncharacterized protein YfiM (DUF2279 family)
MSHAIAALLAGSLIGIAAPAGAGEPGAPPRLRAPPPASDPWWGRDKALHLGAGALLGAGGYAIAARHDRPPEAALLTGVALAMTVGIGKEVADRYTAGQPSSRDLAWDAMGAVTGALAAWLTHQIVRAIASDHGVSGAGS